MFHHQARIFALLSVICCFLCCVLCAQTVDRPNVILILSDDQGSLDANCYGAEDLMTPGIDRLAATGIRFTSFYVGAALCSPSRAAIMTGASPQAAGLSGNASSYQGVGGLPSERTIMAELLKAEGYATAHIGKWHLGYSPETMPNGQGFDYSFGHMGGCIDNYSHFFYWNGPNRHDLWENGKMIYRDGEFFPDLMAEKAEAFIKDHKAEPFFMYYAINVPHYPYQPTAKWRDHYQDMEMPRRDYAGFVSTMDENIDRLLNTLEEEGIRENTIVIFLSDHGHSVEERAFRGGGYAGPYRGSKMSLFEGGIRVPCVISWPAKLEKGVVRDQLCMSMDWYPTLADWLGIEELPKEVEGESLKGVLEDDQASPHPHAFWKMGRQWAVRQGDWKLVGNPRDPTGKIPVDTEKDQLFLSNLAEDIGETNNLASSRPDKLVALKALYLSWQHARPGDIPEILPPLDNKAFGATAQLLTNPHRKYSAKGATSLIDNQRGTYNFLDGNWLGFLKQDMLAEINLGKNTKVDTITFRCMQDQGNYIFLPAYFEVEAKLTKGDEVKSYRLETGPDLLRKNASILEFNLPIGESIQSLKIRAKNIEKNPAWHQAPGADAFLFIDEIIFK